MPEWVYDERTRRYRNVATGRYLSASSAAALRDDYVSRSRSRVVDLAGLLTGGQLSLERWVLEMRERVEGAHLVQYAFGRGGRAMMEATDRATVRETIAGQWAYLDQFGADVAAGRLTPAQVAARATLYLEQTRYSYERGRAAAARITLPAYPGDGGTECRARCQCTWAIVEVDEAWHCTWVLHAVESCADCIGRAARWAPLIIPRGG